jgi:hypothetical protein
MKRKPAPAVAKTPQQVTPPTSPVQSAQNKEITRQLYLDNWPIRRKVMFSALAYCAGNIQYLLIFGMDTALNREIATTLVWAGVGIIAAYVFGASWDDMDKRRQIANVETAYIDETRPPLGDEGE